MADKVRQAVVIVHGMGEQRPLDALNGFIHAAIPPGPHGPRQFYSRPDEVTDSYESRRLLVPTFTMEGKDVPQTEVFEYHWAHMMEGNRLSDMWPTFRRMLLQPPWAVPAGLKIVWLLFWVAIVAAGWAFWRGPLADIKLADFSMGSVVGALVGGGVVAVALTYVVAHVLPSWITTSFVDVVRYLDTSPRSYEARRLIREGMIDLLSGLHDSGRYQRIILVAHSLGAYIAYDGIAFLWARMNKLHDGGGVQSDDGVSPDGLRELEETASALGPTPSDAQIRAFRRAQRDLWVGLRRHGNPWLITDFVSVGTPMYFAHRLYTKNRLDFDRRVNRRELPACPPLSDLGKKNQINDTERWYSWNNHGRRVVYEGAPFAVVRWTNVWFPAALGFFGDWFGGPLAPLFGKGISDVKLTKNRPWRWTPGYAHSLYFRMRKDSRDGSLAGELRRGMDLASTTWVEETLGVPEPDPRTAATTAGNELLPPRPAPLDDLVREVGVRISGWVRGLGAAEGRSD
jgi:hypothetical protein